MSSPPLPGVRPPSPRAPPQWGGGIGPLPFPPPPTANLLDSTPNLTTPSSTSVADKSIYFLFLPKWHGYNGRTG